MAAVQQRETHRLDLALEGFDPRQLARRIRVGFGLDHRAFLENLGSIDRFPAQARFGRLFFARFLLRRRLFLGDPIAVFQFQVRNLLVGQAARGRRGRLTGDQLVEGGLAGALRPALGGGRRDAVERIACRAFVRSGHLGGLRNPRFLDGRHGVIRSRHNRFQRYPGIGFLHQPVAVEDSANARFLGAAQFQFSGADAEARCLRIRHQRRAQPARSIDLEISHKSGNLCRRRKRRQR